MGNTVKRVVLVPAQADAKPTALMLDGVQLSDLGNAIYGCGWFRHMDGPETTWFNLNQYRCVCIEDL